MKSISFIFLFLFCVSLSSAVNITAGDPYSFPSEQYDYYTVVGNSSNMLGMDINWDDGNIIIDFNPLFKPDNFTLIFFNKEKEVIKYYSSGGGSSIIYKDKNVTQYVDRIVEADDTTIGIDDTTISDDGLILPPGPIDKDFFLWRFFRWLWGKLGF